MGRPGSGAVELDETRIVETLHDLDAIGNRFHATSGEAVCRDYLLDRFSGISLDAVRFESFRYLAYEPIGASCTMAAPYGDPIPCRPLQFTASAEIEAEAVFLGRGTKRDLERLDALGGSLEGKIAVIHTPFP